MTPEQRDKLLDLHRASTNALESHIRGEAKISEYIQADDAFRAYLLAIPTTEATS